MIVRQATLDDIGSLIDNCAAMHRESAYSFLPFDREKVAREISACLTNPAAQCGFVAEDENRIVGMLGGYVGEYFFCTETVATDMVFFVDPKYRGSLAPRLLIEAFRGWARARGAVELCLSISTSVNAERTGKFYEAMGLKFVGGNYKQRLRNDEGRT